MNRKPGVDPSIQIQHPACPSVPPACMAAWLLLICAPAPTAGSPGWLRLVLMGAPVAALVLTAAAAALATPAAGSAASSKRNVLYIVFDDLRPDLSPYGQSQMSTPHIQHLADTGVVFDRAFVQISVCSPSRMSFSTGRRPNGTQAWK